MSKSHAEYNQENYQQQAELHNQIHLESTLLLAYRDIPQVFQKYLPREIKNCRYLDYGCGAGLSTQLYTQHLINQGQQIEIHGMDLNKENLKLAAESLPSGQFYSVTPSDDLSHYGKFDLITCNFVLLEMKEKEMQIVLRKLQALLNDKGLLIVTNCTRYVYDPKLKWHSFNADFLENRGEMIDGQHTLPEDHPVKIQIFINEAKRYTFFDFFHSAKAYRRSFENAKLKVLEKLKPLGKPDDHMAWQSEEKLPVYSIHVLRKPEMSLVLNEHYRLYAYPEGHKLEITLYHDAKKVGTAHYVSDGVDVGCITHIDIEEKHSQEALTANKTVGHALLKFLLKFPTLARKLEFRFLLNPPAHLLPILEDYHFELNRTSDSHIYLRTQALISEKALNVSGIQIKREIEDLEQALNFLRNQENGADWQQHLTIDRLSLLVKNAEIFAAYKEKELIGFCRVVSDGKQFASLWDMVVAKPYQGKGVGTAILREIFSDAIFKAIPHWAIFTHTAVQLYAKFGFETESSLSNPNMMIKLRLQDAAPEYMSQMIQAKGREDFELHLDAKQSLAFLFSPSGKRRNLHQMWNDTLSWSQIQTPEEAPKSELKR